MNTATDQGLAAGRVCAEVQTKSQAEEARMRIIGFIGAAALSACMSGTAPAPAPAPAASPVAAPTTQAEAPEMTAPVDLSTPEAVAFSMMRAMYQGDQSMIDAIFLDSATLRRVTADGEVRPDGLQGWRDWVGTLEEGDAYEELFGVTSNTFGNLATVWAPFMISVKGELVGCGVNQLTLARVDGDWRAIFVMDTHEPRDTCGDFKARYLAAN